MRVAEKKHLDRFKGMYALASEQNKWVHHLHFSSTELKTHEPQKASSYHAALTDISSVRVICHQ